MLSPCDSSAGTVEEARVAGEARGDSFAERLDQLLRTVPDPATGKPYSVRAVAASLTAAGHPISHSYLNNLRNGSAADPRRSEVAALARFFGVSVSYFTDSWEADGGRPDPLREALSTPGVMRIALRLGGARLSAEGLDAIEALVEHVARVEGAARRTVDPGRADTGPAERC
jgi:hypothetical protein